MINKYSDFNETKPYGDYKTLPPGGYVLKITGAKLKENSVGQHVQVRFDILEGEYKDFYMSDYQSQSGEEKKWRGNYLLYIPHDDGSEKDGWTKRRFKTFTQALEDSNNGYHFDWDEEKFKGKLIGGLFNEREYEKSDGSIGRVTNLAQVCSVEKIRSGKFKLPKDKLLSGGSGSAIQTTPDGFMSIPDSDSGGIPWD